MGRFDTTWKRTQGIPGTLAGRYVRDDYRAMIRGDGYQVRQHIESDGMGDNFFASMRCARIGDPAGYPTYGRAILACLEYAGIADKAGRHFVEHGPGQITDVDFSGVPA